MSKFIHKLGIFSKRFNIQKYFSEKKIQYQVIFGNRKQLNLENCPFCNNINSKGNYHPRKLYVDLDSKLFMCYNCDTRGNIVRLLSGLEKITQKDIVDKYIYGDFVEILPELLKVLIEDQSPPKKGNQDLNLSILSLPSFFYPLFPYSENLIEPYNYLESRGFLEPDLLKMYDIRFCKSEWMDWGTRPDGRAKKILIKDRIVFPIWFKGQIRGWQGRDITGEQEPKYLINKGLQKQKLIYNYDNIYDKEYVTIVEGVIDVIKSYKINATCLFGKHVSKEQLNLLLDFPNLKSIYICLDDDQKAQEAAQKICYELSPFFQIYSIHLLKDKDPGDLTFDQMVELKDKATLFNPNTLTSTIV